MGKYRLVKEGIVSRGVLAESEILEPEPVSTEQLHLVHRPDYVTAILDGSLDPAAQRRIGFPWSPQLPERSLRTVGGTLAAAGDALREGAGIHLAGGTHHAFPSHGEGYCVFNDVAIAIRVLQRDRLLARATVIDLDVHQGNGTAAIFAGDPSVFTFSMHGARNYPFKKEPSHLDLALEDGAGDGEYLELLSRHLGPLLDRTRPELLVYLAGADPYAGDRLGRLALSIEGLRERDRRVFEACRRRGIPVVTVLGGGYPEDLADLVTIHANTVSELLVCRG